MLTLLLSAALLAGPPEPQHTQPAVVEEIHQRPLSRFEVALPGLMTLGPAVATHLALERNPLAYEANPVMRWATERPARLYLIRGAIGGLMSYAAHRSQKRWLVYGWSGLMLCETGWDIHVALSW